MSLPKAILFDLDDTLLDYDSGAEGCWRAACELHVSALPGVTAEQLLAAIADQRDWYWQDPRRHRSGRLNLELARREIVAGALQRIGLATNELANCIARTYSDLRDAGLRLFPDALEVLSQLRSRGTRLALVTNGASEVQRGKIERFGLAPYFDCILVEGEFGTGKPDERVYGHAMKQLCVAPADTWMVGDNLEWEVEVPQRLGMVGIWYDVKGNGLPPSTSVRPDRVIRRLGELLL